MLGRGLTLRRLCTFLRAFRGLFVLLFSWRVLGAVCGLIPRICSTCGCCVFLVFVFIAMCLKFEIGRGRVDVPYETGEQCLDIAPFVF